jgi:uncharacterized protein (DUF1810 family)
VHDSYNLARFIDAQEGVYDEVLGELHRGKKATHWMWFIFPQIAGLGHSEISDRFSISSINEARAYLEHPILGSRLSECVDLVMQIDGKSAAQIFGYPDDLKFRSCLTLFSIAGESSSIYQYALDKYFDGEPDSRTLDAL